MLRQKPEPSPPYAGARTADNRVDPSPATGDKNEMREMFLRKPGDEVGMRKGGKVKATGPVKVHKGEFVIRPEATRKQGAKKMAALNAGKAKIVSKGGKRK